MAFSPCTRMRAGYLSTRFRIEAAEITADFAARDAIEAEDDEIC